MEEKVEKELSSCNKVPGWFLPIAEKLAHVCLGVIEIQPSPFNLIYGSLGAGSEKTQQTNASLKEFVCVSI